MLPLLPQDSTAAWHRATPMCRSPSPETGHVNLIMFTEPLRWQRGRSFSFRRQDQPQTAREEAHGLKCVTKPFTLGTFLVTRNAININPPYQRESGVWSTAKKQLFIDSLMNEFDVPK